MAPSSGSYSGERMRANSSKRSKKSSFARGSSYASTDDAIAAPRTRESDVKGTGVAFLDDSGRPIASPVNNR